MISFWLCSAITPSSIDVASLAPRSNGAPTYDAAYLSELKASTPTNRPPASRDVSYDMDVSVDPDDYPMAVLNDVPGIVLSVLSSTLLLHVLWQMNWNQ
jgi:GC-rich sequence DNA-binding factor